MGVEVGAGVNVAVVGVEVGAGVGVEVVGVEVGAGVGIAVVGAGVGVWVGDGVGLHSRHGPCCVALITNAAHSASPGKDLRQYRRNAGASTSGKYGVASAHTR